MFITRITNLQLFSFENENSEGTHHQQIEKYRIMNKIFRNRLRKYNKMSYFYADLINYRIMNQQN